MATASLPRRIGPADRGRQMTLDQFHMAEWAEGWLYELARGVLVVTEVPLPPHGRRVLKVARLFYRYDLDHPGVIKYQGGGAEARIWLRGLQSDRHPDQAVYLTVDTTNERPWGHWIPEIVVEIISKGSRRRDLIEKRAEYLRFGVREYWILDPKQRVLIALVRAGDVWDEVVVPEGGTFRSTVLPGLEARTSELLGDERGM